MLSATIISYKQSIVSQKKQEHEKNFNSDSFITILKPFLGSNGYFVIKKLLIENFPTIKANYLR